ncbi:MAG: SLBB domain-containing protein [Candidatus Aminicenantia bacterium]
MKQYKKKFNLIFLAILFLCGTYTFSQEEFISEYQIGPKDLLEINVFELKELNTTVRVSEDGSITLPLLGEIQVTGLTKTQLEKKLCELLEEKYLNDAQVTIFIKEYQSKRVSVLGAVKTPGTYELVGRKTLLQIISQAGGLTNDAGDKIFVLRQYRNGETASLKIEVDELILNGNPKFNIPLQPGDIINIPPEKIVYIYVFGQVRNPGALEVKKAKMITLLQAIAQAGGFTERASKGKVLIKRKDESGRERRIKVNVKNIIKGKKKDIPLKENDVIYVPETIF